MIVLVNRKELNVDDVTPTQEDWVLICQPRGASQSVAEVRLVQLRRNA